MGAASQVAMLAPMMFPRCLLAARSAAAAARHARRALLLSEWRSRRLWPSGARFILPDDDCVPFLKVSCDDLGYTAVGETRSNQAGLDLLGRG